MSAQPEDALQRCHLPNAKYSDFEDLIEIFYLVCSVPKMLPTHLETAGEDGSVAAAGV